MSYDQTHSGFYMANASSLPLFQDSFDRAQPTTTNMQASLLDVVGSHDWSDTDCEWVGFTYCPKANAYSASGALATAAEVSPILEDREAEEHMDIADVDLRRNGLLSSPHWKNSGLPLHASPLRHAPSLFSALASSPPKFVTPARKPTATEIVPSSPYPFPIASGRKPAPFPGSALRRQDLERARSATPGGCSVGSDTRYSGGSVAKRQVSESQAFTEMMSAVYKSAKKQSKGQIYRPPANEPEMPVFAAFPKSTSNGSIASTQSEDYGAQFHTRPDTKFDLGDLASKDGATRRKARSIKQQLTPSKSSREQPATSSEEEEDEEPDDAIGESPTRARFRQASHGSEGNEHAPSRRSSVSDFSLGPKTKHGSWGRTNSAVLHERMSLLQLRSESRSSTASGGSGSSGKKLAADDNGVARTSGVARNLHARHSFVRTLSVPVTSSQDDPFARDVAAAPKPRQPIATHKSFATLKDVAERPAGVSRTQLRKAREEERKQLNLPRPSALQKEPPKERIRSFRRAHSTANIRTEPPTSRTFVRTQSSRAPDLALLSKPLISGRRSPSPFDAGPDNSVLGGLFDASFEANRSDEVQVIDTEKERNELNRSINCAEQRISSVAARADKFAKDVERFGHGVTEAATVAAQPQAATVRPVPARVRSAVVRAQPTAPAHPAKASPRSKLPARARVAAPAVLLPRSHSASSNSSAGSLRLPKRSSTASLAMHSAKPSPFAPASESPVSRIRPLPNSASPAPTTLAPPRRRAAAPSA